MTLVQAFALTPAQARAAFGAVQAVVAAGGPAGPRGTELLEVAAAALEQDDGWRDAQAVTLDELASVFDSLPARRALADALLVPACIEGEVSEAGEAKVTEIARALGVRSHWVRLLGALRRRRVLAIKRQLYSRSPDARRLLARTWGEEGVRGLWRALLFVLGRYRDPSLAARFAALATLPEGTFGRRVHDDFCARGLAFPGELGGMPERMIHHDLMHVVNGYDTDPAGECELAGFYAGCCSRWVVPDAFTFVVTVLATFQLGIPVSPAIVRPARGAFDPARVVAAFERGCRLRVDVMGAWDYWSLFPLSAAEVRSRLGIVEPTRHADADLEPSSKGRPSTR